MLKGTIKSLTMAALLAASAISAQRLTTQFVPQRTRMKTMKITMV